MAKQCIEVDTYFDGLGNIVPVAFFWNIKQYTVDKIIDVRRYNAVLLFGGD